MHCSSGISFRGDTFIWPAIFEWISPFPLHAINGGSPSEYIHDARDLKCIKLLVQVKKCPLNNPPKKLFTSGFYIQLTEKLNFSCKLAFAYGKCIKTSPKYHFYLNCLKIIGFDKVHSCNARHDIIMAYVMTKILHWEIQEALWKFIVLISFDDDSHWERVHVGVGIV